MRQPNLVTISVFGIVAALLWLVYLVLYWSSAPIFTRYEDGSYCTMEGTPWQQCDCSLGWPCDDTIPTPVPVAPPIGPVYST